jgi:hypothetical protein
MANELTEHRRIETNKTFFFPGIIYILVEFYWDIIFIQEDDTL